MNYTLEELVQSLSIHQGKRSPQVELSEGQRNEYAAVLREMYEKPQGCLSVSVPGPAWHFLRFLNDTGDFVFHGSNNRAIDIFEPRKSNCLSVEGNETAIYASSDPIQPIFYAAINRSAQSPFSISGLIRPPDERCDVTLYYFARSLQDKEEELWSDGCVYVLWRKDFEEDAHGTQWRCAHAVQPVAKIMVNGSDFPFNDCLPQYDQDRFMDKVSDGLSGFPWYDDSVITPIHTIR